MTVGKLLLFAARGSPHVDFQKLLVHGVAQNVEVSLAAVIRESPRAAEVNDTATSATTKLQLVRKQVVYRRFLSQKQGILKGQEVVVEGGTDVLPPGFQPHFRDAWCFTSLFYV